MYEKELSLYAFTAHYCKSLMADIDDSKIAHQPAPKVNTPVWILGHLAICTDYAAGILGGEMVCPKDWHRRFGPKSDPTALLDAHPTRDELMRAYLDGHERVASLIPSADPEKLAKPHTLDLLAGTPIRTTGELLAHLMTTHEMQHLGQLSMWRRLMGFAPLF